MHGKKKERFQLLIPNKPMNVNKLLPYNVKADHAQNDKSDSKVKSKTEPPLFYDKPIHKARKHDLF